MGVAFPAGAITITIAGGDVLLLRICDLCGAAVVDTEDTDLAFHRRWHRITGSGNWIDPATGRLHSLGGSDPSAGA